MEKIHLNYHELPQAIRTYLKQVILQNWLLNKTIDNDRPTETDRASIEEDINELLKEPNTGIDIQVYPYLK